jgi:hypothetical protein
MKTILLIGVCILGFLSFAARPEAHHAFAAEFDVNKVIKLEGTVVKMEWVNPHAWLTISVPNAEGKAEEWSLEFGPPNLLFRKGYRRNTLLPDMKVKVVGFGSADGQRILNVDTVTLPDGKTLKGESNTAEETGAGGAPAAKPANQ